MPRIGLPLGNSSSQVAVRGSLRDRIEAARERLVILVDTSGSMNWPLSKEFDAVRIDAAKRAIKALVQRSDPKKTELGLAQFSSHASLLTIPTRSHAQVVSMLHLLNPVGSTNMAEGIAICLNHSVSRIILVSDGEPDSPPAAMTTASEAKEKKIPIDCVYIGTRGDAGESVMREIAETTGGFFYFADDLKEFEKALCALETIARLQLLDMRERS